MNIFDAFRIVMESKIDNENQEQSEVNKVIEMVEVNDVWIRKEN